MSSISSRRTPGDVRQVVLQAQTRSTRRWIPGKENDPSAVEKVHAEFEANLVEPNIGYVEIEAHTAENLNIEIGSRPVWFVTQNATQRVFLDEALDLFGVAWGPDAVTGKYIDLGFRTEDPIDAFLA